MKSLTIQQLNFAFGKKRVLQNINLQLNSGEITYVLGPNGAGKSTLIHCIAGMLKGKTGEISIPRGSVMNALLDKPFIYPSLTIHNNIRIFLKYHQRGFSQFHERLYQYLELEELQDQRFNKLSQGQQQRALLFISMINDPDIMLLDEPFNGLDPYYTEKFIQLLRELKNEKRIILVNDHIISHSLRLADQIIFLIQHKIQYTIRTENLSKDLYYDKGSSTRMTTPALVDCITIAKPGSPTPLGRKIQDLTDLYTIARQHGGYKKF